ncbi:MAG: cell division protein FtsZ [Gammaproteobacteria bacterium]|nr:cell division protein FtsZ [Gammaproteobacteria bacterium]
MSFELIDRVQQKAVIKVIGVGGAGGNAINHMVLEKIEGVEFICANTDSQALEKIPNSCKKVQMGVQTTKGLGAGAHPEIGKEAAIEDQESLRDAITGCDMLFITAGMGGGTGTGASPIIADLAKELGVLTVGVVTKPFDFEGPKRMSAAQEGIDSLRGKVDSLITIPNSKLVSILGADTSLQDAFGEANRVLQRAVQGIAELVTKPGIINLDFADVRTVMSEMGVAMMGTGIGKGMERAADAMNQAIQSPLLEEIKIEDARGLLANITHNETFTINELDYIGNGLRALAGQDAHVLIGTTIDESLDDEVRVTIVATGLGLNEPEIEEHLETIISDPEIENEVGLEDTTYHQEGEVIANQTMNNIMENVEESFEESTFISNEEDEYIPPHDTDNLETTNEVICEITEPEENSETKFDEFDQSSGCYEPETVEVYRRKETDKESRKENGELNYEILDIPAFLRRQAD